MITRANIFIPTTLRHVGAVRLGSLVIESAFLNAAAFLVSFTRMICTLSIYLILRNLTFVDEVLLAKGLLDSIDGNDAFVPGDGDRTLGAHLSVNAH